MQRAFSEETVELLVKLRSLGNRKFLSGMSLLLGIVTVCAIGDALLPYNPVRMGDVPRDLPPSWAHPLGTDSLGRDVLAQLFFGTICSYEIGFLAGILSFVVSVLVAFVAAYYGGVTDASLSLLAEVFITLPSLIILILIASVVRLVSIQMMAVILAVFSWAYPAKVMRAQVLSLKERAFVDLAKLSGQSGIETLIKEIIPNAIPMLGAYFAIIVSQAMLAEVGLELLGLGPRHTITLGMILYWAITHSAIVRELVWWWLPPCIMLLLTFFSLFFVNLGLDEISNPRLEKR